MDMTQFRPGLPAARVDRELRSALATLEAAQQAALLWFHEVLSRKLYLELGYASMELYAAEALGFSANRTSQFLKLARDLDRLPPLKEAVAQGRLEWTKAQQVGRIASPRTAEKWVEAAEKSSRRELAQKVKAARLAQERRRSGQQELGLAVEAAPLPAPRVAVKLSFDSLDAAQLEAMIEAAKKAGLVPAEATREEAILAAMGALLEGGALRRRNAATHYKVVLYRCEACQSTEVVTGSGRRPVDPAAAAAVVENAEIHDQGRNRNAIPPALRQKVLARDGHRCRAPGCGSTRFLEIHHRRPHAQGGTNKIDNLITLCSRCHRFEHKHPHPLLGTATAAAPGQRAP
jgi:hypothetical protein